MKWLLVTTNPTPNVPGTAMKGGWNVGDQFARVGTEQVIREVDPEAEIELLNVEDRADVMRERPFDRLVLAGRPLFWPKCQDFPVWTHILGGWPGRDPSKVLIFGVGDCYPLPRDEGHLNAAIGEAARRCFRLTTRFETDHALADASICPGAWATKDYPFVRPGDYAKPPEPAPLLNLANFMPDGGHYPEWSTGEHFIWNRLANEIAPILQARRFEIVAHTEDEVAEALRLGWTADKIHRFDNVEEYLWLYARAKLYFGNRMHGAVACAGLPCNVWAVGFDSRLEMVKATGAWATLPSQIQPGEVEEFAISAITDDWGNRAEAVDAYRREAVEIFDKFARQKRRRLFVQLGRAGDLLNVFPLLKREFDTTGRRPLLYTRKPYERLLEGIRYAEPIITEGPFEELIPALGDAAKRAEELGAQMICTQIYGTAFVSSEQCSGFLRESWDRVPGAPSWGTLPLVFDRRDRAREAAIVEQLRKKPDLPYVVCSLSGTSSPLECAGELRKALKNRAADQGFELVDVSAFMCDRFFDLLGILEGAQSIIATDSGVLHLAAATKTPVIALITREPTTWHGSSWRPQHALRIFYDEIEPILQSVAMAPFIKLGGDKRQIFHVWSYFTGDEDTERRKGIARMSWIEEQARAGPVWFEVPIVARDLKRSSADVGDSRPMPYVRDLVDFAIAEQGIEPWQIIALTNADACFTPGITGWIIDRVGRHGACFTHRYDFKRIDAPLVNEAAVRRGDFYPGSDAFFFTREWWERNGKRYPDMILGRQQCDEVLRQLIKSSGGIEIPAAIYHEKHESFWETEEGLTTNPGNKHNRGLAKKWFLQTGYGPNDFLWWEIPRS